MMESKETDSIVSEDEQDQISAMKDVDWSVDHENILVEWADKAMCYRWLHGRANSSFSQKNTWYTIPVIVISTLTGTANFAQDRVPQTHQGFFVMVVGGFNILAGIITTIQQFLKITQLNEAHRVSSIAWDKFYRNIKTEIAKHPSERLPVIQFLKMCKEEFDRLMETSPVIPDDIIGLFNKQFGNKKVVAGIGGGNTHPNGHLEMSIFKPEICDSLVSTNASRNPWFTEEMQSKQKSKQLRETITKASDTKRQHAFNVDTIHNFISNFYKLNNREPLPDEIINNLHEHMTIDTIKRILLEIERNRPPGSNAQKQPAIENNGIFGDNNV